MDRVLNGAAGRFWAEVLVAAGVRDILEALREGGHGSGKLKR